MSKYEIPFFIACIKAFGQRFSMTRQAAFRYLHEHKGLAFLIEFFDVEHLQSMDETIDDLLIICQKNGGTLAWHSITRFPKRMNEPTHHQIANYLIDHALSELVKYVIEDTGCTVEQAMERVYNSPLMPLLQDEEGELYVQSPAYLYELMNNLSTYKFLWEEIKQQGRSYKQTPVKLVSLTGVCMKLVYLIMIVWIADECRGDGMFGYFLRKNNEGVSK